MNQSNLYIGNPNDWIKFFKKKHSSKHSVFLSNKNGLNDCNLSVKAVSPAQQTVEQAKSELKRVDISSPDTSNLIQKRSNHRRSHTSKTSRKRGSSLKKRNKKSIQKNRKPNKKRSKRVVYKKNTVIKRRGLKLRTKIDKDIFDK